MKAWFLFSLLGSRVFVPVRHAPDADRIPAYQNPARPELQFRVGDFCQQVNEVTRPSEPALTSPSTGGHWTASRHQLTERALAQSEETVRYSDNVGKLTMDKTCECNRAPDLLDIVAGKDVVVVDGTVDSVSECAVDALLLRVLRMRLRQRR
jgi:hypothetical protein